MSDEKFKEPDWANTDPTFAWKLIEHYAKNWDDIGVMMDRWARAYVAAHPLQSEIRAPSEAPPKYDWRDLQKVLKAIKAHGVRQVEIAKRVGCSQPTISDIANGHCGKVSPSYRITQGIFEMAKTLGIGKDAAGNYRSHLPSRSKK